METWINAWRRQKENSLSNSGIGSYFNKMYPFQPINTPTNYDVHTMLFITVHVRSEPRCKIDYGQSEMPSDYWANQEQSILGGNIWGVCVSIRMK